MRLPIATIPQRVVDSQKKLGITTKPMGRNPVFFTHHLRLVVQPIIYRVFLKCFLISGVVQDFINSTKQSTN